MSTLRFSLSLVLLASVAVVVSSMSPLWADETAPKAADKPKAAAGDETKDDTEKKEGDEKEKDRYVLPEGGVTELLTFLNDTANFRPKNQAEMIEYRSKGLAAMKSAAEKIKEIAKPEDRQLDGFADVDGILLMVRSREMQAANDEERQKYIAELKDHFANNEKPSKYAAQAAQMLATSSEYGPAPAKAIEVYRDLGAALSASKDLEIAKAGAKMEGAARRLGLVGNTMEVNGTEMDGSKFDWAKLRGKVVLVDFWATWCGPCLGELPNVKKNYELYHDKGFEVVAISLDRDRQRLEEFLKKEQNPWITLHDGDWADNATATHYGVMGIPTVILVDQEGKVVSTRARGPELGKHLEKLLGPAETKEPAEAKDGAKEAKDAAKDEAAEK